MEKSAYYLLLPGSSTGTVAGLGGTGTEKGAMWQQGSQTLPVRNII